MASKSTSWWSDFPWVVKLLLVIFLDPIFGGIVRILRWVDNQSEILELVLGILWIVTGGLFGIGWIIDLVSVIINKDLTILA